MAVAMSQELDFMDISRLMGSAFWDELVEMVPLVL